MTMEHDDHWGENDEDSRERALREAMTVREFFDRFAWSGVEIDPATTRAAEYLQLL